MSHRFSAPSRLGNRFFTVCLGLISSFVAFSGTHAAEPSAPEKTDFSSALSQIPAAPGSSSQPDAQWLQLGYLTGQSDHPEALLQAGKPLPGARWQWWNGRAWGAEAISLPEGVKGGAWSVPGPNWALPTGINAPVGRYKWKVTALRKGIVLGRAERDFSFGLRLISADSASGKRTTSAFDTRRASALGDNLIVNGDFEAGAASPDGVAQSELPGWTVSNGKPNVIAYGTAGGFPDANTPGPTSRGNNFLSGGNDSNSSSSFYQTVDLSAYADAIDLGNLKYDFSAYLGGFAAQGDNVTVAAYFRVPGLEPAYQIGLEDSSVGPISVSDRGGATSLLLRSATGFVPAKARSVYITVNLNRVDGDFNDGYVDNISLTLSPVALATGNGYAWGLNTYGNLGTGRQLQAPLPTPIDWSGVLAGKTLTKIVAQGNTVLALDGDGQVYGWGYDYAGVFGQGTSYNSYARPIKVAGGALAGKRIVEIALAQGGNSATFLDSDGKLYACGANGSGLLGIGAITANAQLTPVAVDMTGALAGKRIVHIAGGDSNFYAIDSVGVAYAWGSDSNGLLGDGNANTSDSSVPVKVDATGVLSGKKLVSIAAASRTAFALDSEGQIYSWGSNADGLLGTGQSQSDFAFSEVPVAVKMDGYLAGKRVTSITADHNAFVLTQDGRAYGWGNSHDGQLGSSVAGDVQTSPFPVDMGNATALSGKKLVSIAQGESHTLALDSEGAVYTWGGFPQTQYGGINSYYFLWPGDDAVPFATASLRDILTPVKISARGALGSQSVAAIAANRSGSFALTGTPPNVGLSYDPLSEFSSINPNGAWSYGFVPFGSTSFSLYDTYDAAPTAGYGQWHRKDSELSKIYNDANAPSGGLMLAPSAESNAVLRWTAPYPGTFKVNGQWIKGGAGDKTVSLFRGATPLQSADLTTAGQTVPLSLTLDLAAGETLDFTVKVGPSGDATGGEAGLQVSIVQQIPAPVVVVDTSHQVKGRVFTKTGAPQSNVPVYMVVGSSTTPLFFKDASPAPLKAITDANGNFVFEGVRNGPYTIFPSLRGKTFAPVSASVAIPRVDDKQFNFQFDLTESVLPVVSITTPDGIAYATSAPFTATGTAIDPSSSTSPASGIQKVFMSVYKLDNTSLPPNKRKTIAVYSYKTKLFVPLSDAGLATAYSATLGTGGTWRATLPVLPAGAYRVGVFAIDNAFNYSHNPLNSTDLDRPYNSTQVFSSFTVGKDVVIAPPHLGGGHFASQSANKGEEMTYSLAIANSGDKSATGLIIEQRIDTSHVTLVPKSWSRTPSQITSNSLIWNVSSLEAGGFVTISFRVKATIDGLAPLGYLSVKSSNANYLQINPINTEVASDSVLVNLWRSFTNTVAAIGQNIGNALQPAPTSAQNSRLNADFGTVNGAGIAGRLEGFDAITFNGSSGVTIIPIGVARVIAIGGGNVITAGGANVITAGGGNVITAGGANVITIGGGNLGQIRCDTLLARLVANPASVITAGGGNVITAGGGNLISNGLGSVITLGGGNLVDNATGQITSSFLGPNAVGTAGVITAGGGNVITAGGGNVITAGGGNVITAGGGNVITAGGAN